MGLLSFSEVIRLSRGIFLSWSWKNFSTIQRSCKLEKIVKLQCFSGLTLVSLLLHLLHLRWGCNLSKCVWGWGWVFRAGTWWVIRMRSLLFPRHPLTRNGDIDSLETLEPHNFTSNQLFKTVMTFFMWLCVNVYERVCTCNYAGGKTKAEGVNWAASQSEGQYCLTYGFV